MQTIKTELMILTGFILILAGTIVLERPFIIRTYENAAAFGLLCDTAMSGNAGSCNVVSDEDLSKERTSLQNELDKARSYNMNIYAIQRRQGFVYEDSYIDPEYDDLLSGPNGMMCVIEIPSIHVLLPVGHGTGTVLLRDAAGHVHGTSLPVGGPSTHSVIAAHSGIADRELFTNLPLLQSGDAINIYVLGEKHTYIVDKTTTCLPSEAAALSITEGSDMITLMTCVPYGINTHRLLVRGVRHNDERRSCAADLMIARQREYARSVLYMTGMFLLFAAETAFYTMHVHKAFCRIKQERSM